MQSLQRGQPVPLGVDLCSEFDSADDGRELEWPPGYVVPSLQSAQAKRVAIEAASPEPPKPAKRIAVDAPTPEPPKRQRSISVSSSSASKPREKRFECPYPECGKRFVRPVRLEEHIRSHTGERPFVCETCQASFYRESHLHAHVRIHIPDREKPHPCPQCDKRFWTNQHLKKHIHVIHEGAKYPCPECGIEFHRRHLVRTHAAEVHCLPGSTPFVCDKCDKAFKQMCHLKAHLRTHDLNRYMCVHEDCLALSLEQRQYSNWTALQRHMKTGHPPRCPFQECGGQTFATRSTLKLHLKLHKQREGCEKTFLRRKSPKDSLTPLWDEPEKKPDLKVDPEASVEEGKGNTLFQDIIGMNHRGNESLLDFIVGRSYKKPTCEPLSPHRDTAQTSTHQDKGRRRKFACPYADLKANCILPPDPEDGLIPPNSDDKSPDDMGCAFRFYRLYDVGRHLKSVHKTVVDPNVLKEYYKPETT